MADIEKYIEEMKNKTLYEARTASSLAGDVLQQWPTNIKVNVKMAVYIIALDNVVSTFAADYKGMADGFSESVITMNRGIEGWAICKAIEAEGMSVAKEAGEMEKQQKKKILGLF